MEEYISFSDFAFCFGASLLLTLITVGAWKSTKTRNSSTYTLVLVQRTNRNANLTIFTSRSSSSSSLLVPEHRENNSISSGSIENASEDPPPSTTNGSSSSVEPSRISEPSLEAGPSNISTALGSNEHINESATGPSDLRFKLKFMEGDPRDITTYKTQSVKNFAAAHFGRELAERRTVRLIFQGKLVKQDEKTLEENGIYNDCVVHCHISRPKDEVETPPAPPAPRPSRLSRLFTPRPPGRSLARHAWVTSWEFIFSIIDDDAFEPSQIITVIAWIKIPLMWLLRIQHGYLFNPTSTIFLLFYTAVVVIGPSRFFNMFHLNIIINSNMLRSMGVDRVLILNGPRTSIVADSDNNNNDDQPDASNASDDNQQNFSDDNQPDASENQPDPSDDIQSDGSNSSEGEEYFGQEEALNDFETMVDDESDDLYSLMTYEMDFALSDEQLF